MGGEGYQMNLDVDSMDPCGEQEGRREEAEELEVKVMGSRKTRFGPIWARLLACTTWVNLQ